MASFTYDGNPNALHNGDTIDGVPADGSTMTVTTWPALTFNPFQHADFSGLSLVDGGDGTFTVTIGFLDAAGATLALVDDQNATSYAQDGSTFPTFTGTTAAVTAWLQQLYVVGTNSADSFTIQLAIGDDEGDLSATLFNFTFETLIACYMEGTLIATPSGQRPVESLMRGDLVTTADGSAKPVKWIGHRTYEAGFGASEAFVRPVVFKAGSLGGGLPVRDLKVSPQHGMQIDGVMVPAAALVNDVTIVREEPTGAITYFHIELDGHEAVLAEGAASETFVDHNSRAMFDNADEYSLIHGTAAPRPAEQPRLEEGFQLAAIRRRLAEIAGIPANAPTGPVKGHLERIADGVLHGWLVDTVGAEAVEAEVLVDGEVVGRVVANRYRGDLDQAGIRGGRGGFSIAVPASAERLEQVSLRRVIDGQILVAPAAETVRA